MSNGKGSRPRIKDYNKYWAEYDLIFKKDKKKVDNFGDLEYDSFHDLWSRIENGARVWYYHKPE